MRHLSIPFLVDLKNSSHSIIDYKKWIQDLENWAQTIFFILRKWGHFLNWTFELALWLADTLSALIWLAESAI